MCSKKKCGTAHSNHGHRLGGPLIAVRHVAEDQEKMEKAVPACPIPIHHTK